jgi:hypothetical protein
LPRVGLQTEEDINERELVTGGQEGHEDPEKYFGDLPVTVPEGQIRLCFTNIYGIPAKADHPKNNNIKESINRLGASVLGFAETNLYWKKVAGKDRWEERRRGWWENNDKHIMSYNIKETPQHTHQPGGAMHIIRGQTLFRVISQGVDKSNMGRWCWALLSGKRGITTRIITAYRPCLSNGIKSTYMQQKRIMDATRRTVCPRSSMVDDLAKAINDWMSAGDQIILMIDLNDDVINSNAARAFRAIGLRECISQRHNDINTPSTCNKGTRTIDGIFTSSTINITRGGYLPYSYFPTDHRALWIDVTMANLCGNRMAEIKLPQARRLKCNDPKTQRKWTQLYIKYLTDRKAISRAYKLQAKLQIPLPDIIIEEYEKLRKIRMNARTFADKRCRKLCMGKVPYSPELAAASSLIELWKAIISWKMGRKHNMKHIQRLEIKNKLTGCRDTTLEEAKRHRSNAYKKYWEIKKQAKELRQSFLNNKAKDLAQLSDLDSDNIYKQLLTRESQREIARKIKFVLKKNHGGGVTKISVLNTNNEWEETTVKEEIEQGCAEENAKKYRQTEDTPCMRGQLAKDLGLTGNTTSGQEILEGTYTAPPGTNMYVQEFLRHLKYDAHAQDNPPKEVITTAEYIQGWRKKKEFTTAGKSGWTFSHSKTCALNKDTANFEATMAHIPYVTGYTPKEWQVGVNIMIYKKANIDRVDKLRTIVLKEADANFNDGKMGKDMMHFAEENNMIAKEQYGSRKGHSSIDHAVNKRLTFDLLRLYRSPGALCSNDAKSCYDRIIHTIAALSMRRLGIPIPPIECMLTSIQKMEHHIRTTHGDSEIKYTSKYTQIPFQGVLQGNGAAPSIWVAVSTPLLNMMRTAQHGLHMMTAISQQKTNIVAFAFVDDTDLVQGDLIRQDITADEVMQEMQQAIMRWEGGLKCTGGALVPEKSFVYPIDFTFSTSGQASYKTVEDIGSHFEAPNSQGILTELPQLEPSDARETLGVYLAPDGNNNTAVEHLREKAVEWSNLVLTGHLTANDVRLAMDTTVIKSLEYPLPALTLTEKECKRIMAPVLEVALPQSHVCRTFPRDVVYGPKGMMGLGVNNLYYTQGAQHIATLQQFIDTDTITGDLLRSSIEMTKIHVGHGTNLFTLDYSRLGGLTPKSWISHLWQFCHQFDIKISETSTSNPIARRENDKFIMECIAANAQFSNNELIHINRCRLFLKVMTLSDITNGNGMLLREGALKGEMIELNNSYYGWPRQERPGISSWRIWRKAIKLTFLRQVNLHLKPEYTLGPWNDGNKANWNWFVVRATQKVYQRTGNGWKTYRRQGRGRMGNRSPYVYYSEAFSLPPNAKRCTVYRDRRQKLRMTGAIRDTEKQERTPPAHTILDNIHWTGNRADIVKALKDGTAKAVSDGSYLNTDKLGTAAFVIEGSSSGNYVLGSHETPGAPNSQCAHRSEMFGMLSVILLANQICHDNDITEGNITAKCDGEGTVKILQNLYRITKNTRKHFDLIISISAAVKLSPLTWDFQHIDGHQDDHKEFEELDRWAQLNVIVDKEAKQILTKIIRLKCSEGSSIMIPFLPCTVSQIGEKGEFDPISSHLAKSVRTHIQKNNIREYWKGKMHFSEETMGTIDWDTLQKSVPQFNRYKWLSKFVTGICGVGYMLKIWKHQSHSLCPRCGQDNEKTEHVLLCQESSATQVWDKAVEDLDTWMSDNLTEPSMQEAIISGITSWRTTRNHHYIANNQILRQAILEQGTIGWNNLFKGFISNQWKVIQKSHLEEIGSLKSPILWISRFQRRIWLIPWNLWQHRNGYLHNDGTTIHFHETVAIDQEITAEYETGRGALPSSYSPLFQHNLANLLHQSTATKKEWLISVWVARDNHTPGHQRQRNIIAVSVYNRWRKQLR